MEWIKHKGNPIFTPSIGGWDSIIEDFVVVRDKGVYHAFYSGGQDYVKLNAIGLATSRSPLGPFERHGQGPVFRVGGYTRVGSILRIGRRWMMYCSRGRGEVVLAESRNLTDWKELWVVAENAIQPCCQPFGDGFLMLATDMKDKGILAFISYDGVNFGVGRKILRPMDNTGYAFGISNPSFITADGGIEIFLEGRKEEFVDNKPRWKIFGAEWDGHREPMVNARPALEPEDDWERVSVANPCICRFGKKHYLYYSGFRSEFGVGVAWRDD